MLKNNGYPSHSMPAYQLSGYHMKKAYQIYKKLESLYQTNQPCLFEWFAYAKDELFCDTEDCNKYSSEFFKTDHDEYDCILEVKDNIELHYLLDELHATALLRAEAEPVRCMICFTSPDTLEEIQLFRDCRHAFCKECIR